MNVLDLGCGRGSGTFLLKREFNNKADIYGIDIDKKNIERANRFYGKECEFVLAKGERLPFQDNFFDFIYCREVLEHVTSLNKTFSEINRVLKKGGEVVSTFPSEESENKLAELNKEYLKQIGHKRIISIKSLTKELSEKFTIKYIRRYNSIEHLYWVILFKRKYKIINENGDLNKPIPRLLKFFEELLNPDKKDQGKGLVYKIIRFFNKIFSKTSYVLDLFFIKKRTKVILVKK